MRRLLLALPFALLPLTAAVAHDAHDHEHGTLGAHEHGVASLNVALDGNTLELELDSPAMNLVGFEHAASSDADKATVARVREQLADPRTLFILNDAARCSVTQQTLESPLFGQAPAAHEHAHEKPDVHAHEHEHEHEHSDIHAHYALTCTTPGALTQLDLAPLFQHFPATRTLHVQLIGPNGQKGLEATATQAKVAF